MDHLFKKKFNSFMNIIHMFMGNRKTVFDKHLTIVFHIERTTDCRIAYDFFFISYYTHFYMHHIHFYFYTIQPYRMVSVIIPSRDNNYSNYP